MKKLYYILLLVFLSLITLAEEPLGSVCWANNKGSISMSKDTKFKCSSEISTKDITIEELYKKGYRVVSSNIVLNTQTTYVSQSAVSIIIEKIDLKQF